MIEQSGDSVDATAFEVGKHQVDQAVVLTVSGEVDMLSAPQLAEAIQTALAAKPAALRPVQSRFSRLSRDDRPGERAGRGRAAHSIHGRRSWCGHQQAEQTDGNRQPASALQHTR